MLKAVDLASGVPQNLTGRRLNHTSSYGIYLRILVLIHSGNDAHALSAAFKSDANSMSHRCQVLSKELWLIDQKVKRLLTDALNLR